MLYYNKDNIKIYYGDTLQELKALPDESIDCCITSPPYYGLRTYGVAGQIGLEKTFAEYMQKILAVTSEIKRILKKTGSFWLNMGDFYYGGHPGGSTTGGLSPNFKLAIPQETVGRPQGDKQYKSLEKCLCMQPERIALAMIDQQGWILRNKIKWVKQIYIHKQRRTMGSVMPSSVKDRFNESGEELYFFVKSKKYYFDLDAVRLPQQTFENRPDGITRSREYQYDSKFLKDYSPKAEQGGQRFNYRVRDAKRKEGQPQFKATKEEILNYAPADHRGENDKTEKNYGLKRKVDQTAEFFKEKGSGGNTNLPWKLNKVKYDIENRQKELVSGGVISSAQRIRGFYDTFGGQSNPQGKNLPSCWLIQSEPHNFSKELNANCDHFATYPQALCEIPIKVGCPEDGIVLDPFCGSGTTGVVALKLGRKFIGIELNEKYLKEISIPRLEKERTLFNFVREELSGK